MLTLSIIQSALAWEDPAANRTHFETLIRPLQSNQLVVLPEMFTTGFSMQPQQYAEAPDGPTVLWMQQLARQKNIVITGSIMIAEGEKYFNRMLWVQPNGHVTAYNKRHLFAYAGEHEHYTPGAQRVIASLGGWRILLQVCYDLRFPVFARQQMSADGQPEYDALIYVANWPNRRSHAWKTLLQARAIENQCYVIGVNRVGTDAKGHEYSGDSMVVDPIGHILHTAANEPFVYTTTLSKEQLANHRKLPFLADADRFQILV